jgi:Mn2+/Fe2+ NRAMP family transporter
MQRILSPLLAIVLGVVIGSSVILCVQTMPVTSGHMHHASASGLDEHLDHIQAMTIAIVPALLIFILIFSVVLFVVQTDLSFVTRPFSVSVLHDPPRRKKLKRILFSLRSPPLFS